MDDELDAMLNADVENETILEDEFVEESGSIQEMQYDNYSTFDNSEYIPSETMLRGFATSQGRINTIRMLGFIVLAVVCIYALIMLKQKKLKQKRIGIIYLLLLALVLIFLVPFIINNFT